MVFILSFILGLILFKLAFDLFDKEANVLYNIIILLLIITIVCIFGFWIFNLKFFI